MCTYAKLRNMIYSYLLEIYFLNSLVWPWGRDIGSLTSNTMWHTCLPQVCWRAVSLIGWKVVGGSAQSVLPVCRGFKAILPLHLCLLNSASYVWLRLHDTGWFKLGLHLLWLILFMFKLFNLNKSIFEFFHHVWNSLFATDWRSLWQSAGTWRETEKQEVKASRAQTHFSLDEVVFAPSCASML